jgi:alkanesulfonate monooxygenase SsuD/methylene tetrahydromethanopterin reductase-like flavin-dependent oxidoreductase (luciferase family)
VCLIVCYYITSLQRRTRLNVGCSAPGGNVRQLRYSINYSICGCINVIYHRQRVRRVAQSVQCLATYWTTGRSGFDPRQGQRIFPLASVSRPALGPTQPPVHWVLGVLSPELKRGRGVTLTTHPHLVPR